MIDLGLNLRIQELLENGPNCFGDDPQIESNMKIIANMHQSNYKFNNSLINNGVTNNMQSFVSTLPHIAPIPMMDFPKIPPPPVEPLNLTQLPKIDLPTFPDLTKIHTHPHQPPMPPVPQPPFNNNGNESSQSNTTESMDSSTNSHHTINFAAPSNTNLMESKAAYLLLS